MEGFPAAAYLFYAATGYYEQHQIEGIQENQEEDAEGSFSGALLSSNSKLPEPIRWLFFWAAIFAFTACKSINESFCERALPSIPLLFSTLLGFIAAAAAALNSSRRLSPSAAEPFISFCLSPFSFCYIIWLPP